jgi:phosphatidylglycerol lysyltransferase
MSSTAPQLFVPLGLEASNSHFRSIVRPAEERIESPGSSVSTSISAWAAHLVALFDSLVLARSQLQEDGAELKQQCADREKVHRLVEEHGRDSLDGYAQLGDKSYFFTQDGRAAVPYVLSGNLAVALADPIGSYEARRRAIGEFVRFCRKHDQEPVFYETSEGLLPAYEQAGFAVFKIGEEARLNPRDFHLRGGLYQNLRTICNKSRRLGVQFRWYDASEGVDEELERQLTHVSQRWLAAKKAREMSFDMGAFSLEDIRRDGAGVAIDATGAAVAFATWRPYAQGTGRALDLMRSFPTGRSLMDFVLVESIFRFASQGLHDVSLGTAPLANTSDGAKPLVAEEKAVQFLYENLNRFYSYKSLFEFKRKYRPVWQGRYVAYRRGAPLPLIGLALVRVHTPEGWWKFLLG